MQRCLATLGAGTYVGTGGYQCLYDMQIAMSSGEMQRRLTQKVVAGVHIGSGGDQSIDDVWVLAALSRAMERRLPQKVSAGMHARPGRYQLLNDSRVLASAGCMQRGNAIVVSRVYVCSGC